MDNRTQQQALALALASQSNTPLLDAQNRIAELEGDLADAMASFGAASRDVTRWNKRAREAAAEADGLRAQLAQRATSVEPGAYSEAQCEAQCEAFRNSCREHHYVTTLPDDVLRAALAAASVPPAQSFVNASPADSLRPGDRHGQVPAQSSAPVAAREVSDADVERFNNAYELSGFVRTAYPLLVPEAVRNALTSVFAARQDRAAQVAGEWLAEDYLNARRAMRDAEAVNPSVDMATLAERALDAVAYRLAPTAQVADGKVLVDALSVDETQALSGIVEHTTNISAAMRHSLNAILQRFPAPAPTPAKDDWATGASIAELKKAALNAPVYSTRERALEELVFRAKGDE